MAQGDIVKLNYSNERTATTFSGYVMLIALVRLRARVTHLV